MADTIDNEVEAYLGFWRDSGLTDGFADGGTDWFAPVAPAAEPARIAASVPAKPRVSQIDTAPEVKARVAAPVVVAPVSNAATREQAQGAQSLDELRALLEGFTGCGLKATAKQLCFYRGPAQARLMLIGEAPGRDEDLAGKPFVGRAGQLLDKMLASIGLDETHVHITNTVYWRPPGNRTPTPEESLSCWPFLARQMELVNPDFVLVSGGVASKQVLGIADGITKVRGTWRKLMIGAREVPVLATLHPSYLLRTPAAKRQAWQDMLMIQAALASGTGAA
jgi:uracil-DNA glycosylase